MVHPMNRLVTKSEFARTRGVNRQTLHNIWSVTDDHPNPVFQDKRLALYHEDEISIWWEVHRRVPVKKEESEDRKYQVNSRFTRAERARMAAVSKPGETFSSIFRRMALIGLEVAEMGKEMELFA
jgi:hypothetical protein